MIQASFLSIHPQFIEAYFEFGAFKSAASKGLGEFNAVDLRRFAVDHHGSVDARPYGGGDGMVLRPEPLRDALQVNRSAGKSHVIYTSPKGKEFSHKDATRLAELGLPLTFVCGRFGGVDQRFIDRYVDEEFSLGRFVVSGGELPCLMICDAVVRQIDGVLGHEDSARMDSFAEGYAGHLEHPLYTKPDMFEGESVPSVLLSGNHAKIEKWKKEQTRS